LAAAASDNVPAGQWEAAKACNLSATQTWTNIIIPQAIPPMIPALANYFIAMFKETPLLSAITVLELMNQAQERCQHLLRYIEPITLVGAFFLRDQPLLGRAAALAGTSLRQDRKVILR